MLSGCGQVVAMTSCPQLVLHRPTTTDPPRPDVLLRWCVNTASSSDRASPSTAVARYQLQASLPVRVTCTTVRCWSPGNQLIVWRHSAARRATCRPSPAETIHVDLLRYLWYLYQRFSTRMQLVNIMDTLYCLHRNSKRNGNLLHFLAFIAQFLLAYYKIKYLCFNSFILKLTNSQGSAATRLERAGIFILTA